MHHESISVKNFIGLKPRISSPANLSMFMVYSNVFKIISYNLYLVDSLE